MKRLKRQKPKKCRYMLKFREFDTGDILQIDCDKFKIETTGHPQLRHITTDKDVYSADGDIIVFNNVDDIVKLVDKTEVLVEGN